MDYKELAESWFFRYTPPISGSHKFELYYKPIEIILKENIENILSKEHDWTTEYNDIADLILEELGPEFPEDWDNINRIIVEEIQWIIYSKSINNYLRELDKFFIKDIRNIILRYIKN